MSVVISRRPKTNQWQYRNAPGLSAFPIGIAILERGDDLIHIAHNKNEHPISVAQIRSAKSNRDRHLREGVRCSELPVLAD
jgi:hypothetical protein